MADARDIMTANPLMVGSGTEIPDAVEFFNQHHISSAPVQNPLGEILGHLTEINLVKALVRYRAQSNYSKVIHAEELFDPVTFVNEYDEIPEVLRQLVRSPTHRVLVRDQKDRVIGIISPKDLLRTIQGGSAVGQVVVDEVRALQMELDDMRRNLHEMNNYLQTYDTVFQSGMFGLHSIDRSGRIVFANDRLHDVLGFSKGELIGKTIFDIYPLEIHQLAQAGLRKVMEDGRHTLVMSKMVKKDRSQITVDLASAALKDEKNRFIGTFTISRVHGTDAMKFPTGKIFESSDEVGE